MSKRYVYEEDAKIKQLKAELAEEKLTTHVAVNHTNQLQKEAEKSIAAFGQLESILAAKEGELAEAKSNSVYADGVFKLAFEYRDERIKQLRKTYKDIQTILLQDCAGAEETLKVVGYAVKLALKETEDETMS